MSARYIAAIDQGTTSSRCMIFDAAGAVAASAQVEHRQYYPRAGWVEHDALEIWANVSGVVSAAMAKLGVGPADLAAVGVTNQRETTLVWEKATGKPIAHAIVWQDRRTSGICDKMKRDGLEGTIQKKTGLVIDAYFSGTKVQWILDNVKGARANAEKGKLAFGTVDSWLIWKLTGGMRHVTDITNASRTMLFDIRERRWHPELLALFGIPAAMLPEVVASSTHCATTRGMLDGIPIAGIAGDQQAALFGQMCVRPGMSKCTFGTGAFMLMNTGTAAITSRHQLLTTVAWQIGDRVEYALEGSMMMAGAVVQWLRDGLEIIRSSADVEALAESVPDSGGIVLVPAFAGLGAPHWDQHARGTILGMTRGTTKAHIARAALEAIALQAADVLEAMGADAGCPLAELRVDGGAAVNNLLLQLQADVLGIDVVRPRNTEATALGAAYLAGLAVGFWPDTASIASQWHVDRVFHPAISSAARAKLRSTWKRAIERSAHWQAG